MVLNQTDKKKLKEMMGEKRFTHTVGVVETITRMAEIFSADPEKAELAAWLHDCARSFPAAQLLEYAQNYGLPVDFLENLVPDLLHGRIGAEIARTEFGVHNQDVLNAIRHHTLGDEKMTILDKLLFVADMIEPNRDFPGVDELRRLAFSDLDEAFLAGLNSTIIYVINRGGIIHPKSIQARNAILLALSGKNTGR